MQCYVMFFHCPVTQQMHKELSEATEPAQDFGVYNMNTCGGTFDRKSTYKTAPALQSRKRKTVEPECRVKEFIFIGLTWDG